MVFSRRGEWMSWVFVEWFCQEICMPLSVYFVEYRSNFDDLFCSGEIMCCEGNHCSKFIRLDEKFVFRYWKIVRISCWNSSTANKVRLRVERNLWGDLRVKEIVNFSLIFYRGDPGRWLKSFKKCCWDQKVHAATSPLVQCRKLKIVVRSNSKPRL